MSCAVEKIEPRREDRLHGVGDHDLLDLIEGAPPIALADEVSLVDQLTDDLLEEERVAFGPFEDPGVHGGREIVDREQLVDEPVGLLGRQRIECDRGVVATSAPPRGAGRGQVRPRRTDEEHRSHHTLRRFVEQVQQRRIGPVDVLHDDDERRLGGERREERPPARMDLLPDLARFHRLEVELRIGDVHRERECRGRPPGIGGHVLGQQLATRLADLLERELGRVRVQDSRVAFEDLRERPVRDPLAVREAPSSNHGGAVSLRPQEELRGETALPHTGVAVDRDEVRPALGRRSPEHRQEQRELLVTTDHRGVKPRHPAVLDGCRPLQQLHRRHRLSLSFQVEPRRLAEPEAPRSSGGSLRRQDAAGLRGALETCRDVHRIARHHRLAGLRIDGREDLTGVDPDPDLQRDAAGGHEPVVHVAQPLPHPERRPEGADGVVFVRGRNTEDRHHRVADELLDRAAFGLDLLTHRREVARHHLAEVFGVEPFAELRRTGDVGEQDRDDPALFGRVVGVERQPARRTEPSVWWKIGAAAGTGARRHRRLVSRPDRARLAGAARRALPRAHG